MIVLMDKDVICLDLRKAYDIVLYNILVSKLEIWIWRVDDSVDNELIRWPYLNGCDQWLNV